MKNIDRLAKDLIDGLEKSEEDYIEVPIKLLIQILFRNQVPNAEALHKKLLTMKTKYAELDYLAVMQKDAFVRFYKKSLGNTEENEKEIKLITMEEKDGRIENISAN